MNSISKFTLALLLVVSLPTTIYAASVLNNNVKSQKSKIGLTGLQVISIKLINKDPRKCIFGWSFIVKNFDSVPRSFQAGQATQGTASGQWVGAAGVAGGNVLPGKSFTSRAITFARKAKRTKFRVQLYNPSQFFGSKTIALPRENIKVSIQDIAMRPQSFKVTLKNHASNGLGNYTLQTFASKNKNGPWRGSGGYRISSNKINPAGCFFGKSTYKHTFTKRRSERFVKIQILANSQVIVEKIKHLPKQILSQ